MPFPIDPQSGYFYHDFPIGTRVMIATPCQDFHFFYHETGTVIRNSGKYLGVIVQFDEPRHYANRDGSDAWTMTEFGFNPGDLVPLEVNSDERS